MTFTTKPSRASDALLASLVVELRAIGCDAAANEISAPHLATRARAAALHGHVESIELRGRQIYLRTACTWLGRAYEAAADGRFDEALRWRERAEAELERYRCVPEGGVR